MTETLPQKSGSIDKLITLEAEVNRVLNGEKTAVRRNGKYADPGDTIELKGKKFEIHQVYRQILGELTDADAKEEGFSSLEDYKQSILAMHPGMPWLPQMQVWVHKFRPLV